MAYVIFPNCLCFGIVITWSTAAPGQYQTACSSTAARNRKTAILFPLSVSFLYIRLTHSLPRIPSFIAFVYFQTRYPNGWPLLDSITRPDLEKLDHPLKTLVCECPSVLGWVFL